MRTSSRKHSRKRSIPRATWQARQAVARETATCLNQPSNAHTRTPAAAVGSPVTLPVALDLIRYRDTVVVYLNKEKVSGMEPAAAAVLLHEVLEPLAAAIPHALQVTERSLSDINRW